jgi:hypothetical protein
LRSGAQRIQQQIRNANLSDPNGKPNQIKKAATGANTFTLPPTYQKAQP